MDAEKTLAPCWPGKEFPTGAPKRPVEPQLDGWDQPVSSPLTNAGRGRAGSAPFTIRMIIATSPFLITSTDVHRYPTKHEPKDSLR